MKYSIIESLAARLYIFSLAATAFTIPFYRGATNLALLFLAVSWILWILIPRYRELPGLLRSVKVLYPVVGTYLIALVGLTYSNDIQLGLNKMETLLPLLVFPVLLSGVYYCPRPTRDQVFNAFILGISLAFLVCLAAATYLTLQTGSAEYINPENKSIENFFFYHRFTAHIGLLAVYFAFFLTLAVLIQIFRLIQPVSSRKKRFQLVFGLLFLLAPFFLLQSANLILALAIALMLIGLYVFVTLGKEPTRLKIWLGAGMVVVGLVTGYVVFDKILTSKELFSYDVTVHPPGNWNPVNLRLALWEHAWILIKDHWLIGVGTGSIGPALERVYADADFYFALVDKFHPHNQFLYSLAAWGIPGLIMFVTMLLVLMRFAVVHRDFVLFGLTWVYFQFSFTESTLVISKGMVFFYFFVCLMVYSNQKIVDEYRPDEG